MALKSLKTNISSISEYEEEVRGLYTISDTQRLNFRETQKQQGFPSEKKTVRLEVHLNVPWVSINNWEEEHLLMGISICWAELWWLGALYQDDMSDGSSKIRAVILWNHQL